MPDDDSINLPNHYGENYLYLLDVDPTHIHVFWEIIPESISDQSLKKSLKIPDLWLKVHCDFQDPLYESPHGSISLRVKGWINDWFVEIDRPLKRCYAELGYQEPGENRFTVLCHSNDLDLSLGAEDIRYPMKEEQEKGPLPEKVIQKEENKPSIESERQDKSFRRVDRITEEDIRAYYRLLPERLLTNPDFSPWRSILERMISDEAQRVWRLSEFMNLYLQYLSPLDIHSSHRPNISSDSSVFKSDQDR